MTSVLLMILAAAWAAFLLPPLIRRARNGQFGFRRRTPQLGLRAPLRSVHPRLAERGAMAAPVVALRPNIALPPRVYANQMASNSNRGIPRTSIDARRRRRRILVTLIVGALASFVFAVYLGGFALVVHLLIDALLLGYAMLLVQHQRTREDRLNPVGADDSQPRSWDVASGGQR